MHPIERLRWVARAPEGDAALVAAEAARALAGFADEPAGLVTACRRLILRRPECGPLWWLSARMLCALDPVLEAVLAEAELEDDPTDAVLATELPGGTIVTAGWPEAAGVALAGRDPETGSLAVVIGERWERHWLARSGAVVDIFPPARLAAALSRAALVLLEAEAVGPAGFVARSGSSALAAAARAAGRPVWLVAGVGRVLPGPLYDALTGHLTGLPFETVPLGAVEEVATSQGLVGPGVAARRVGCPTAPELLRLPR